MPEFKAVKRYQDNGGLSSAQLDALFDSIEDWTNAREIDDQNIAADTITASKFRSDFVDGTTLEIIGGSISVAGGSISASDFTADVSGVKVAPGSVSIVKFKAGTGSSSATTTGYVVSDDITEEGVQADFSNMGEVQINITKATAVLLECVPNSPSAPLKEEGFQISAGGGNTNLQFIRDGSILAQYQLTEPNPGGGLVCTPATDYRLIYFEDIPGTHTYALAFGGTSDPAAIHGRLLVKEL